MYAASVKWWHNHNVKTAGLKKYFLEVNVKTKEKHLAMQLNIQLYSIHVVVSPRSLLVR